jgi:hypothetical protein
MRLRHRVCALSCLRGMLVSELDRGPLDIGFALAARDRGSPLPLETEDRIPCFTARLLARRLVFSGCLDLSRKGRLLGPAVRTHEE